MRPESVTRPSSRHRTRPIIAPGIIAPSDEEWKVYDILVDGISLIINYRSTFNATVASSGIDGLIQLLRDKNAVAQ